MVLFRSSQQSAASDMIVLHTTRHEVLVSHIETTASDKQAGVGAHLRGGGPAVQSTMRSFAIVTFFTVVGPSSQLSRKDTSMFRKSLCLRPFRGSEPKRRGSRG